MTSADTNVWPQCLTPESTMSTPTPTPTPAPAPVLQPVADFAITGALNAGVLVTTFGRHILGREGMELDETESAVHASVQRIHAGDMREAEAMLYAQAVSLQTMFTSFALRAQRQTNTRDMETYMRLALKAQGASRASLQALTDLKYPRPQATFVKQANITSGPQQINNSGGGAGASRDDLPKVPQNKLLEEQAHEINGMDTGAAPAPARGDPAMEAVGAVHRAKNRKG